MSSAINGSYTKRYRKKVATRLVVTIGAIVVLSLVVISYLGSLAGNYTIRLQAKDRSLTIADNPSFLNNTTRLNADAFNEAKETTLYRLPSDDVLDHDVDEDHPAGHNSATTDKAAYLAYTFYLKNSGDINTDYYVSIDLYNIDSSSMDVTNNSLVDILRVMIYENTVTYLDDGTVDSSATTHNHTIYAEQASSVSSVTDSETGQTSTRECVAYTDETYSVCRTDTYDTDAGRAVPFLEDEENSTIINYEKTINVDQVIRYTVVMWLEGTDPQSEGNAPVGAQLKLSMDLTVED